MHHLVLLWRQQPVLRLAAGLETSFTMTGYMRSQKPLLQSSILYLLNKKKQTPKGQQTAENRGVVSCQTSCNQPNKVNYLPVCSQQQDNPASGLSGEWGLERTHPQ